MSVSVTTPWMCMWSHPWSGIRLEEADPDHGTWTRVTVKGEIVFGPTLDTTAAVREYNRLVQASIDSAL
jgi:hypothetical protein